MSHFWSPAILSLKPYVPGEQPKAEKLIKLNTNENPYPPAPGVSAVLSAYLQHNVGNLRLYPDPESTALKNAMADYYSLKPDQVFVGNGSDEVLAHVFFALFRKNHPILFPDITYSFYPVYCDLYGIAHRTVPLADDFTIQFTDYLDASRGGEKIGGIIFPNPNAPTGCLLPLDAIANIAGGNPMVPVVIDEAYIDFGGESASRLIADFPNLLVVQTFSKSRSLAGMRVGFALGNAVLIEALKRVKNCFNSYPLDKLAEMAAMAALEDKDYFYRTTEKVIENRQNLSAKLENLGFQVLPSAANFILAKHPLKDAAWLMQQLRADNIIVRHFNAPRIADFLRISIGTAKECDALVAAFSRLIR